MFLGLVPKKEISLNPYYTGSYSISEDGSVKIIPAPVLILIILEVTL